MSSSIDQLKDNVAATLESTGVLARIRAELRAEVFAAIEMQKPTSSSIPQKIDEFAHSEFGTQSLDLVMEFLQFFGLKHTLSVFKAETHRPDATLNRDSLWNAISSTSSEFSLRKPLLYSILEQRKQSVSGPGDSRTEKDPFTEPSVTPGVSQPISIPQVQVNVTSKSDPISHQTNLREPEPSLQPPTSRSLEQDLRNIREPSGILHDSEYQSIQKPDLRTVGEPKLKGVRELEPSNALKRQLESVHDSEKPKEVFQPELKSAQKSEIKPIQESEVKRTESNKARDPEPSTVHDLAAKSVNELKPSFLKDPVSQIDAVSRPPSRNPKLPALLSPLPSLNVPKGSSDPMSSQLHQIDDLLKQLDSKQQQTDQAKAELSASSHQLIEEFPDNDDIEFDDDDFDYDPDDTTTVQDDDHDELFPGFSTTGSGSTTKLADKKFECFSDDPSADDNCLDAFDVVYDAKLRRYL